MNIYNYNKDTGIFTCVTKAKKNPLVPEEYLLPASATFDSIPEEVADKDIIRRNNEWIYVAKKNSIPTTKWGVLGITENEWNATEYQRLRKAEYDKLNQDELRFDDLINGTTAWQDAILVVKAKYPKPTKGE